jgi:tetratricopeptide (TPR) repeat protein
MKRQNETQAASVPRSKPKTNDRTTTLIICTLLVLAVIVVYGQSIKYDFITTDDYLYVTNNPHVKAGLTCESVRWAFTSMEVSNWHPLTWISLMIDYRLSGMNPSSYHATNIVLHALNAVLLLLVLRRLTGSLYRSAFVAALFALHPIHVESVAWISERKDVLSTMFWFLGIWAYLLYLRKPSAGRYGAVMGAFVMGLMAKPMLVSFPITLLLLDIWPLRRLAVGSQRSRPPLRLFLEKVPLFALSIVSCFLTFWAQKAGGAVAQLNDVPFNFRMMNAVVSYVIYLGKMIWPLNLAIFYPHPMNTLEGWKIVACLIALAGMTYYSILTHAKRAYVTFGWLWYVITLAPVIGIVQIGSQGLADRYTYVPFIGIFVIIAWGAPDLVGRFWGAEPEARRRSTMVLRTVAVMALLALASLAYGQVRFWKDDITTWTHAVEVAPGVAFSEYNLGRSLHMQHRDDEAMIHYRQAVRIDPNRFDAYNNLGIIFMDRGAYDEAESALESALRAKPDFAKAYYNMGLLLCRMKRFSESFHYYTEAIRLDPEDKEIRTKLASSHCDYGIALAGQGNVDEAIRQFKIALDIAPQSASAVAHYNLGVTYAGLKKFDLAKTEYEKAILADPNSAESHNNLGILLGQLGDVEDAIAHFKDALRIKPDFKPAADNLRKISEAHGKGR